MCVYRVLREFVHSSRTHLDARRFSRVRSSLSLSLSLVCAREKPRERRCVSAFRGACFLVDVGIARSSVASVAPPGSSSSSLVRAKLIHGAFRSWHRASSSRSFRLLSVRLASLRGSLRAYARSMCFCVYNRCVLSLRLALLSPAATSHTGVPVKEWRRLP